MNSEKGKGVEEMYKLDLKNHCLFCLQQYSLDEVSSFAGKNIRPFELIRNYFFESGSGAVFGCNVTRGSSNCAVNQEENLNLPPTCKSCFTHFKNLKELQEQLVSIQELIRIQLKTIREIVSGAIPTSADSLQWNHFKEILLTLGQPEKQVKMTCELVKNLQRLITNNYERGLDCDEATALAEVVKQETADDLGEVDFQTNDSDDFDFISSLLKQDDPPPEDGDGLDWKDSLPNVAEVKKRRKKKKMFPPSKKKKGRQIVLSTLTHQECDLCGVEIPIEEILSHVEGHVKEYARKCPNPWCPCVFSCQQKMVRHLKDSRKCKRVAPVKVTRETAGVDGKCQVCNFSARSLWHLREHLKVHEAEMRANPNTTDAIKECPIPGCGESFYLLQSIEYHLFRHNLRSTTQQNCPLCDESFEVTEMESHLKDIHQVTEIFKCNHCSFLFNNIDEKIKHVYEHREEKGVSCDICNDDTVKIRPLVTLQQHYFNVHQLGTLPAIVVCQHCGNEYSSSQGLKMHERVAHPDIAGPVAVSNKKVFKCDLCPHKCSSADTLTNHKIKVHGAAHLPCKFCSETFRSMNLLDKHLRMHTGATLMYKCKIEGCNREFKLRTRLSNHYETCHWEGEGKPHKCDTCGKGFGLKKSLQKHNEAVHLKTRVRCVCDECGKSFARPEFLKAHKVIHTGEKPYVCNICGYTFSHPGTLWHHTKSHEKKGDSFKGRGRGPFKNNRKRSEPDQ